jgi:hypothetical protein
MYDETYELRVTIEDRDGRIAHASLRVTPFCAEPAKADRCRCVCDKSYILGDSCSADVQALASPGTCPNGEPIPGQ